MGGTSIPLKTVDGSDRASGFADRDFAPSTNPPFGSDKTSSTVFNLCWESLIAPRPDVTKDEKTKTPDMKERMMIGKRVIWL